MYSKSDANLEIAKHCLGKDKNEYYSVGVSRAYYAVFQTAKSILVDNCFDYKSFLSKNGKDKEDDYSHGTIRFAVADFIRKSHGITQEDLKFVEYLHISFGKLYTWRIQGDYRPEIVDQDSLKDAIQRADKVIKHLRKFQ